MMHDAERGGILARAVAAALAIIVVSTSTAMVARDRAQDAPPPPRPIDIVHYDAEVEPDLEQRTVRGTVRIRIRALASTEFVSLDRGDLTIDAVRDSGVAQEFTQRPRRVVVTLARPLAEGEVRDIEVAYHGAPPFGLQFAEGRSQVYTIFTTSQWLVSVDEPDDRATLRLRVTLPARLRAAGVGIEAAPSPAAADGRRTWEWRLDAPAPTYTFGFAAGPFAEVADGRLRLLGQGFSDDELRRVFAETEAMLRFFERRAGVPYSHQHYTQVLVARTVGQEMSGLSLLSDAYGRGVLADPTAITLGAHEAAHQWWGNLVTCEAWTHFWLNEGLTTFMAAAFMEERFGRPAYDRAVAGFRREYERVRLAGGDKSLVFADWNRPSADDRTLVYQKGALVMHELRGVLGDDAFWEALRYYTRTHAGRSVTTAAFQAAFEASSGRDLSGFFAQWVYRAVPARQP